MMRNQAGTKIRVYVLDPYLLIFLMVKDFSFSEDFFFRYIDFTYLVVYSSTPNLVVSKLSQSFTQINDSAIIDTTIPLTKLNHTSSYTLTNPIATAFVPFTFPDILDSTNVLMAFNTIQG